MEILSELLSSFNPDHPTFRPTEIYNECWLIKLALHQAAAIPATEDNSHLGLSRTCPTRPAACLRRPATPARLRAPSL